MNQASMEKILIIGPAWIGDMVMAQSLFILLQQQYPDSELVVMAPAWTEPLLARMPQVSESLEPPFQHGELALGRRRALGKSLRGKGFTRAIVLPNSFKSALVPFHANIPVRTGWRGEFRNFLLNDCRKLQDSSFPLQVQRFAALALPPAKLPPAEIPSPALVSDKQEIAMTRARYQLDPDKPVLALCPGAEFGPAKRWPEQHFAAVCNFYLEHHWQVCLFGSAKESELAAVIVEGVEQSHREACFDLTGKTSLGDAIDLLAGADLVLSNDSGLMHVAAALGKPMAAIYGSTTADFTPPLAEQVKLLWNDIDCRPCFKRECPYGHLRCLVDIKPDRVIQALEELVTVSLPSR